MIPKLRIRTTERSVQFNIAEIQSLHPALQRRLLRWGIDRLGAGLKGIGFQQIETIRSKLLSGATGKAHTLPRSLTIRRRDSDLLLERADHGKDRLPASDPVELPLPEKEGAGSKIEIGLPSWELKATVTLLPGPHPSFSPCTASFDFDRISLPLFFRSWQPGDAFMPSGMKGRHKKLQDFFVDAKIAKAERGRKALLVCAEGIVWVVGLRTDERFRVTERTKRTLVMEVQSKFH